MRRIALALAIGLIFAHATHGAELGPAPPAPVTTATVVGVVDGDTLHVLIDDDIGVIRLADLDAPDLERRECWAPEASRYLQRLLPPNTTLTLTYEPQHDAFDGRPAHVWANDNRVWVNGVMLAGGHAYPLLTPTNGALAPDASAAVRHAKQAGAGVWSCPTIPE